RLSRPGQPRDDDELVPRDLEVDVLEIVLARAPDDDSITGHDGPFSQPGANRATRRAAEPIPRASRGGQARAGRPRARARRAAAHASGAASKVGCSTRGWSCVGTKPTAPTAT